MSVQENNVGEVEVSEYAGKKIPDNDPIVCRNQKIAEGSLESAKAYAVTCDRLGVSMY